MCIDIVCNKEEGSYFIIRGNKDKRHYFDLDALELNHPELSDIIRVNGPYLVRMMNERKEMMEQAAM